MTIKDIEKGQKVGYNGKYSSIHNEKIATISIGYADGLSFASSKNGFKVFVKNNLFPIIGNICMDTTIIKELSLQEIIFEKKYIQCYDMSISDFSKFEKIEIVFPPTNEMQHIKMWPPYGTYDEKGNKVRDY